VAVSVEFGPVSADEGPVQHLCSHYAHSGDLLSFSSVVRITVCSVELGVFYPGGGGAQGVLDVAPDVQFDVWLAVCGGHEGVAQGAMVCKRESTATHLQPLCTPGALLSLCSLVCSTVCSVEYEPLCTLGVFGRGGGASGVLDVAPDVQLHVLFTMHTMGPY
jgi:hypothetical protein